MGARAVTGFVAAAGIVWLFTGLLSGPAPLRSREPDPALRARLLGEMEQQRDELRRFASVLRRAVNYHPRDTPYVQKRAAKLATKRTPNHASPELNALAREITELQGRVAALVEGVLRWDDRALVRWLQASREESRPPQDVLDFIFRAPTLSTLDAGQREVLMAADLQPVPGLESGVPEFRRYRTVMYWVRHDPDPETGNPRVIGLVWDADGTSTLFHALIPPP